MIRFIHGVVKLQKNDSSIVVTSDGIGWHVKTGNMLFNPGDELDLYIYTQIRENEITLWGFKDIDDLELFELLVSVNGVGAKIAQALLLQKGREGIVHAIVAKDSQSLVIPGVGKKTSEKLIFSLKDKISDIKIDSGHSLNILREDREVIEALIQLGYAESHVVKVVSEIEFDSDMSLQQKIKLVLKNI